MTKFQPITRERFASKRWKRYNNYSFAADTTVVPLAAGELSTAVLSLPLGFLTQGERKQLVAVLSLVPGRNVFVAPDGRWIGPYVPAAFRSYPFAMARTPDEKLVLCIAEDSNLVTDGPDGEVFFGEEGKATEAMTDILKFLHQVENSRMAAQRATDCLDQHGLLQPWSITLKTPEGERQVPGLYKVDEAALNAVSAEILLELRQAGGLYLAYCQMLSMQHLPLLGKLADAQAKALQQRAQQKSKANVLHKGGELDLEFMNSETINFSGLSR